MSEEAGFPGEDPRLFSLFDRYQQLREQGRQPLAVELCPDDPALAARLQHMIEIDGRIARLANTPVPVPPTETLIEERQGPDGAAPTLERYEVLGSLGQGGMGAVYHARDRVLGREVALKVIRAEAMTQDMRRRFLAEARAVAAMDHPNIVRVYDVSEWIPPGGTPAPYLAIEYVTGGSLTQHLGEAAMEPAEAARLVRLLARAIGHAHGRGVIHRDLKPDNVLMGASEEGSLRCALGCPKVSDFGLARQQEETERLTRTGAVMGTPAYMAPEQAEGLADVGPPADVHALGAILYRLLTGKVPFEAPSAVELLFRVIREAPVPVRQLNPKVPPELERICLDCMSKAPTSRPTALQLAERLDRFLEVGGAGKGPMAEGGARRFSRRQVVGAALGGAALLGLGGWGLWPGGYTKEGPGESTPGGPSPGVSVAAPLTGELVVRVWAPQRGVRGLRIGIDDGAVPVREDEQLQAEVTLSEPAHAYLLWIDGKGVVTPLFPWNDGKIEVESTARVPKSFKGTSFRNPSRPGLGWPVDDTVGLDLWLLLARREPWPARRSLAGMIGTVPAAPLRNPGEVVVRGWERGVAVEAVRKDLLRRPKGEAREIDDQLEALVGRLVGEFELIRAVQFAHVARR